MARKKKTQTGKTDAPEGAADDVTAPAATAHESPETTGTHAPGADPAKAEEATAKDSATADTTEQDSSAEDTAPETGGETATTDATPDPEAGAEENTAEETSPDDTADTTQDTPGASPQDETEQSASDETETTTEEEPKATAEGDAAPSPTDRAADPAPVVRTEQVTVRQGGFWSMLIGGIAAAGIGVAAAPYIYPYLPVGSVAAPSPADDGESGLATRLDEQAQRISDLGARIDEMPAPADPSDEISGLSETVTSLTERIANLEVQLSNLEVPPTPEAPDTAATNAALDALRESLAAQGVEIEELRARLQAGEQAARDSARATLQRAALTRVMTALDTGEEFTTTLTDLRDTGADVPDALAAVAETGVPTRAQLLERFPDAARAALAEARSAGEGGETSASVGGFLRAQLGVRSLEPREGDDPDAILSRAEAALAEGRLRDALAEIETLPEDARAAMSGWAAEAAARRDALAAAEALSAQLN